MSTTSPHFLFKNMFMVRILCVFVVCVVREVGSVSGIGLARLVREGEIQLRCALWDGRTTRTHATHLDTICISRPVSIPLSLVSSLSRLLSLVCRASLVSCVTCSVSALLLSSLCPVLFVFVFFVCPSLCPSLCLSVRLSVLVSACVFL